MSNIIDYLKWRGDLRLTQDFFNEVDNLILSILSYMPLEGIVGELPYGRPVTLEDAIQKLISYQKVSEGSFLGKHAQFLLLLSKSRRFKYTRLYGYVNKVDQKKEKQFAALTMLLEDGTIFISFRGTDNTLIGWRENFNMSYQTPVPAQGEALSYLEKVGLYFSTPLRVGGVSKGGNLAVYASAFCSPTVQGRILAVYNNDGPGFHSWVLNTHGFNQIASRLHTFIPQSSVVGMLLEHSEEFIVIQSNQQGLLQHDPFSWIVMGRAFIHLDRVDSSSIYIDKALTSWIATLEPQKREEFIDVIFNIISSTGVKNLKEFTDNWLKNSLVILDTFKSLDNDSKELIRLTFRNLAKASIKSLPKLLIKD